MKSNYSKTDRVLSIYQSLMNGEVVNKSTLANEFTVDERTIQRDINDIKIFLAESDNQNLIYSLKYKRKYKGYVLEKNYKEKLTNAEALAVCKVLLASRSFKKEEMNNILDKIILYSVSNEKQELIKELIKNEKSHYVELKHKLSLLDKIWQLGEAVRQNKYIKIKYNRLEKGKAVKRKLKPLAITFSEYYFYLIAYIDDEEIIKKYGLQTIVYRIDRIEELEVLNEQFTNSSNPKFELGDFKNKVQYMYAGERKTVKFKYFNRDIDMVMDRLPTAKILEKLEDNNEYYLIEAEVFGNGIDMWLDSQGEKIVKISERS